MIKVEYYCDKCKKVVEPNDICKVNINFTNIEGKKRKELCTKIEICKECKNDLVDFFGEKNCETVITN